ncbi:MAG: hypothetical protein LBH51_02740, partial [Treponema sp.]|nr:hypothetical protein [Treponema sp.]
MSMGLLEVLIRVIRSWEVLAVTIVLIFYFFLVSHAARGRKRPHTMARTLPGKKRKAALTGEPDLETTESDDLG